jgi:formylglycine-generating enzyme required for sulfatase activity
MVGARRGGSEVAAVLEILRARGLLVRVRGADEPAWELVHDSLVPRVLAWLDARDLDRRRAIELLRHHLRRSTPDQPSLLDRAELRELEAHEGAIEELEEEWKQRGDAVAWTPRRLVEQSRRALRRRVMLLGTTIAVALGVGGLGLYRSCEQSQRAEAERERRLAEREQIAVERERALANIGEVELAVEAFDWDARAQRVAAAPTPEGWRWELRDRTDAGEARPFLKHQLTRRPPRRTGTAVIEALQIRGGSAFLIVDRPGCAPSVVPLQFPSYNPDNVRNRMKLRIPTCAASREGMVRIPGGPFLYGGAGQPASTAIVALAKEGDPLGVEQELDEPEFWIDRTEVTNAAFGVFAEMSSSTGIALPDYAPSAALGDPGRARNPVAGLVWHEAQAYCHFLGKELPTTRQWVKALRGGLKLDGAPNPAPRRNLPWIDWRKPIPARVKVAVTQFAQGAAEVGTHPIDVSPYGIYDLAGNVTEWTSTQLPGGRLHAVRGGSWGEADETTLVDMMAVDNMRRDGHQSYALGMRCASR